MAKTFKDCVYSLLEIATNFQVTDDVEYPELWIEDALLSVHNTLMREAFNNGRLGPELWNVHENIVVQSMNKEIDFKSAKVNLGIEFCYAEIPELVTGIGDKHLHYVGGADLATPYTYRKLRDMGDRNGVVWKLPLPPYTLIHNDILLNTQDVAAGKMITVIGYFRDPREANTYDESDAFPTPSEYKLELLTLQHIMQGKQMPADLINDSQRALMASRKQEDE